MRQRGEARAEFSSLFKGKQATRACRAVRAGQPAGAVGGVQLGSLPSAESALRFDTLHVPEEHPHFGGSFLCLSHFP